jgi:hypothetical protein
MQRVFLLVLIRFFTTFAFSFNFCGACWLFSRISFMIYIYLCCFFFGHDIYMYHIYKNFHRLLCVHRGQNDEIRIITTVYTGFQNVSKSDPRHLMVIAMSTKSGLSVISLPKVTFVWQCTFGSRGSVVG